MFSREESRQMRELFWTSFGKSFPRKWTLYNTKINGLNFKFHADRKVAMVCLDLDLEDEVERKAQWEKLESLKAIIENDYIPEIIYDHRHYLEDSKKEICRIFVKHEIKFSIHNKDTWGDCYEFFVKEMSKFEDFFEEYKDFIEIKKD